MRTRGDKSTGFRRSFLVYSFPIYPFLIYPFLIYLCLTLPCEPAPPTLTLAFVGDVMLGRGVAQALDGDWDAAFVDVQPWLAQADLAFANLESPLTTAPFALSSDGMVGRYDLRAPPDAVAALRAAGFDVVSLANNHALDAGAVGLSQAMATLEQAGIIGVVDTGPVYPSTHLPVYCFLALDDSVEPLDVYAAAEAVTAAADEGGLVIVSVHWGGEYQASPSPRQRTVARALADAGAGLVIGHGPHVLQRVEWLGETLVAYSLGNFLFDQPYPADCRWGAVLRVAVQGDRIVAVDALPTVAQRGRVRRAASEDAAAILARLDLDPVSRIQHQ